MNALQTMESPIGILTLVAEAGAIRGIYFETHRHAPGLAPGVPASGEDLRVLREAERQLRAYFDGALRSFDLPLAARGTPFQERTWTALRAIPFGERCSYAALAATIGAPRAVRAVGGANGRNPLSIVVPCHRVIGSDGSLTGYGGGEERKRWLLAHELHVAGRGWPEVVSEPRTEPACD
jgi:methylated-DNA-[protein]-cysteine S-methyltransferase